MELNMRKIKYLFLVVTMLISILLTLTACGKKVQDTPVLFQEGQSDLTYIKEKGTLVIGMTDYEPMDYREGSGWIGFDADLAQLFAESIGVTIQFQEINWNQKIELLNNGTIDCIWNGMTLTDEINESISCSKPYLSNAQVIVQNKNDAKNNTTVEECQHMLFAVEGGSTGEALLDNMKYRYVVCETQSEALESVYEKKADAAVVDLIMASSCIGGKEAYQNLEYHIFLNDETLCVGLRKNSDLIELLDNFLSDAYEKGTIHSLAEKYNMKDAILPIK